MTARRAVDDVGTLLRRCAATALQWPAVARADTHLAKLTLRANLDLSQGQRWAALGAAATCGALFGSTFAGFIGAVAGLLLCSIGLLVALAGMRHRRQQAAEAQLAGFLEGIARGLRTGLQLGPATLEAAANVPFPLAEEVTTLLPELRRGRRVADVFADWARRSTTPGVHLTAGAVAFAATAGGARARAIDGVAATLRDRAALQMEVRSLSVQARLSAQMIALLPLAFLVLAASADSNSLEFLLTTPLGLLTLTVGLTLDAIGTLWMRRIVARVS